MTSFYKYKSCFMNNKIRGKSTGLRIVIETRRPEWKTRMKDQNERPEWKTRIETRIRRSSRWGKDADRVWMNSMEQLLDLNALDSFTRPSLMHPEESATSSWKSLKVDHATNFDSQLALQFLQSLCISLCDLLCDISLGIFIPIENLQWRLFCALKNV